MDTKYISKYNNSKQFANLFFTVLVFCCRVVQKILMQFRGFGGKSGAWNSRLRDLKRALTESNPFPKRNVGCLLSRQSQVEIEFLFHYLFICRRSVKFNSPTFIFRTCRWIGQIPPHYLQYNTPIYRLNCMHISTRESSKRQTHNSFYCALRSDS